MTRQGRTFDLQVGRTRIRTTTWFHKSNGLDQPHLCLFRHGPNGSPAGIGPKPWPRPLARRNPFAWCIYLPYISWGTCYRLRKVGGLKLYRAQRAVYVRLVLKEVSCS